MDGASAWRRFVSITLPLVKPFLLVAVLFRMLDTLRMFDLPYVLIGPRKESVETLAMLVQDQASNVRYGAAAAYAVILFLYVFAVAFVFVGLLGANVVDDDVMPAPPGRPSWKRLRRNPTRRGQACSHERRRSGTRPLLAGPDEHRRRRKKGTSGERLPAARHGRRGVTGFDGDVLLRVASRSS